MFWQDLCTFQCSKFHVVQFSMIKLPHSQGLPLESACLLYYTIFLLSITLWKKETQKSKKKLEKSSEKDVRQRKLFDIEFFREFDPGSGLTLAACITHSSRTECSNTLSGGRVSNAWVIYLSVRDNNRKQLLIPHKIVPLHGGAIKGLLPKDELASD